MNFKEFLNKSYKLETNKNHMKKLGHSGDKLVELAHKYKVKDLWMDRKDIFITGIKDEKTTNKFVSEIKPLFPNINAIISSPMDGEWSITIDTSKPTKMKFD